ncbi:hypothetical protein C7974DRAFT_401415 [Boeremia exigua]|uniref:uncharacterized protein n=1 Tax=Boeremia exigua TaxID=749465 RepID=UPI001E8D1182|nr:uncharacterized protein C7974DRAFT_401415 [Boeremia exigua]KAH6619056.1 hypothetical protein C7974DRAFT_401415 [Boeremia exigua]
MPPAPPLNITIIGGGIAGLFAARVLREKHNVTVLEKSSGGNEVGAAVTPGPNATKCLYKYGWNPQKCGALSLSKVRTLDHKGALVQEQDVSGIKELFGSDWHVVHRLDLWNELLRLATTSSEDLGLVGQPVKIFWRVDVVKVDIESGDVSLADGTIISADLVIGADGIKSTIRPLVVPEAGQPIASGASMFRFILPRNVVNQVSPDVLLGDPTSGTELNISIASDGSGRSVVTYPCRNLELLNVGCIAPDPLINVPISDSWSAPGTREDLLRVFGDFHLRPILEQAENIKLWQLRDNDPLPNYFKGRTLLIGDAAHAMTPHQGQGASQAIEDGEAMVLFVDEPVTRDTVKSVLRDFDRVRRIRATKLQAITRSVHDAKNPEMMWKNQHYNFTYDGVRDCLAKLDAGKDI